MSQALIPTVEPAVSAPLTELTEVDYTPTPKDWRFLEAVQEAIDKEGKADCSAIGRQLKVTKQAVWKRLQDPMFRAWVNQEMKRAVDDMWSKILYRAAGLSLRGSIDHMNFLAKVGGKFRQRDPDDEPGGQVFTINNFIPRPPD